ncbi:hypothetical protein Tco_0829603 [Tanacetum coccineum]
MEKKYVTNRKFQGIKERLDKVLHEIIPKIASKATNDLIDDNLPRVAANVVIQERDALQANVPTLISKEFVDHASKRTEELFNIHMKTNVITVHPTTSTSTATTTADLQHQLYLKMKSNLQDQVDDPELWDVLKCKFEKSSNSSDPYETSAFCKRDHDGHQEYDAPPEGEKREKIKKTSKGSKSTSGSSPKQLAQGSKTYAYEREQQQQEWDA